MNVEDMISAIQRTIKLYNPSDVPARIVIEGEGEVDPVVPNDITWPVSVAEIPPYSELALPFFYRPLFASEITVKKSIKVKCASCPNISFVTLHCVAKRYA